MNERIRLLAEQAVLDSLFESIDPAFTVGTGNGKMTIPLVFAEKFAEMIVRECISHIEQDRFRKAEDLETEYDDGYVDGMGRAERLMKEHFGVEL